MRIRFFLTLSLALTLPFHLSAGLKLTPQERVSRFTPHIMEECETKRLADDVFSRQIVRDTLFGHIEYRDIPAVRKALKENGGLVLESPSRKVASHPAFPHLLIKYGRERNDRTLCGNISRVTESQKMRDNLESNGVTNIVVPHKWLYHIPGQPDELCDGNYMVFAERMDIMERNANKQMLYDMPVDRARDLLRLFVEVHYPDISDHNIYYLNDGETISVVDTEEWSSSKNGNSPARRMLRIIRPETLEAVLTEEFCQQYNLKSFEVLYAEYIEREVEKKQEKKETEKKARK